MFKWLFKITGLIFCIGIIIVAFLLGFYFGYDLAGDYCSEVLSDCAIKLRESNGLANILYNEEYKESLIKQYEEMKNWSLNISGIIS